MKHKHADLIHAWADGAEIQGRVNQQEWRDMEAPSWYDRWEYRIKTEEKKPVVRWLWAYKNGYAWMQLPTYATEAEAEMNKPAALVNLVKLEWSRTEFPE